jgi:DNA invertase Pin-like site-specific DNA recombinase
MLTGQQPVKKVAVYARCSTSDDRQTVDVQLVELRRHCEAMGWPYEEFSEYDSGYKGEQPKLQEVLSRIKRHEFDCLLVYSLDRLSRKVPSYTNRLLDELVEHQGIRFISKLESIDSANELTWNVVRPIFAYFANLYSRGLSERIKAGIQHKRQRGLYKGGRPKKIVDADRLRALLLARNGAGWRKLAQQYNEGLRSEQQISFSLLRRVATQVQFNGDQPARVR